MTGQPHTSEGRSTPRDSRRDFLKGAVVMIGGLMGTVFGIPSLAFLLSPVRGADEVEEWIDLGQLEDYEAGAPTLFEFTRTSVNGWERTGVSHGLYVVRGEGPAARVFSNVCTHLGCRVTWHPEFKHYISPCHDGHFDLLGLNISGPPPRPLDEFVTRVEDGRLWIQMPPFRRNA